MDRIMAIVKADAYSHGLERVEAAIGDSVHSFGVACIGEAEQLRKAGFQAPIYLLGPVLPQEVDHVVQAGFRPPISTIEEAIRFQDAAQRHAIELPVQWTLDTGMGRVGTLPSEVSNFIALWPHWKNLRLESIATHYPSADEDAVFTQAQAGRFREMVAELARQGIHPEFVHLANSAGHLGYDCGPNEVVRAGLMLYGISPLPEFQSGLRPVLQWKTNVSLVRELPAQWGVSYGRTFITQSPTKVATIAVGYADGYSRHLSNRGATVLIQGEECPILGRVTMDQILADVTHLNHSPSAGDEVVLLGTQGKKSISANDLAKKAGTIPWEIFTSIRARQG